MSFGLREGNGMGWGGFFWKTKPWKKMGETIARAFGGRERTEAKEGD